MYCPECGAENRPEARFCRECRAQLLPAEPAPPASPLPPRQPLQPPSPPVYAPPPPPPAPRRGVSGCVWALIAGGVLVGIVLIIVLVAGALVATGVVEVAGLFATPTPTATSTPIPTDTPTPTATLPPTPTFPPSPFPQACGMSEATADYGPIGPGSVVVLGRHRAVDGDDNWDAEMNGYVGRTASVIRLSGVDGSGCPGIRVDIDDEAWFWRVRDLTLVSPFPQVCGMTEDDAVYGPLEEGSVVILGRHRPVDGDDNWASDMDAYVGEQSTVKRLSGVDGQGCPGVRVAIDDGRFFWRVRDLELP